MGKRYYFFGVIFCFLFSNSAYAYIDPCTGSILITFLVSLLVSISVFLKTYWYKIRSLFFKHKRDNDKKD